MPAATEEGPLELVSSNSLTHIETCCTVNFENRKRAKGFLIALTNAPLSQQNLSQT